MKSGGIEADKNSRVFSHDNYKKKKTAQGVCYINERQLEVTIYLRHLSQFSARNYVMEI